MRLARLWTRAKDRRGAAAIETAAVAAMILGATSASLDLYAYERAQSGALYVAQAMADYVSNQAARGIDYNEVRAYAAVLSRPAIRADHAMVVRLTALHRPAERHGGGPATIPWVVEVPVGNPVATRALAARCPPRGYRHFGEEGQAPALPDGVTLAGGADDLVVQVCVRLTRIGLVTNALYDRVIYRIAALPFTGPPVRPVEPPVNRPGG